MNDSCMIITTVMLPYAFTLNSTLTLVLATPWGVGRKATETSVSVTELSYKSVNLFFEELINIKVILLLIHELFREQSSLK